jgi:hypothetical protein
VEAHHSVSALGSSIGTLTGMSGICMVAVRSVSEVGSGIEVAGVVKVVPCREVVI